ncbi:MAG: hypothetical protein ACKO4A_06070, partial [Gammaproteobacteria bacterium]
MPLHPALAEKLAAAVEATEPARLTLCDARLPEVAGKVHSVIGMRRAGKTTFLRQLLNAGFDSRRREDPPRKPRHLLSEFSLSDRNALGDDARN